MQFQTPDTARPRSPQFGIALGITPQDARYPIDGERAPDDSGAPDLGAIDSLGFVSYPETGGVFVDPVPNDALPRWYRFRAIVPDVDEGSWGPWVGVLPGEINSDFPSRGSTVYPLRRDKALADGAYAAAANDEGGLVLPETLLQTDGSQVRSITKGQQVGTARHSDAVSFSPAFQSPPSVKLQGGITHEPRAKWGSTGSGAESGAVDATKPQYEDFAALDVTATGFTVRARLRQKAGSSTAQSDEFSASNALTAIGHTTEANLNPAVAVADRYIIGYSVELTVPAPGPGKAPLTGQVIVAIDTNDGGGSGWIERDTATFSAVNPDAGGSPLVETWDIQRLITVAGLGLNDDIRVRIKDINGSVTGVLVHGWEGAGAGDPDHGVTYSTASDSFASKTPDTDDRVTWIAAVAG